jgi:uncharacterized protein (TIGR02647 family)
MPFKPDLLEELNVLIKFNAGSQEGLKVHKTAPQYVIDAASRLFEKGLITKMDGGYLTPLGQEAVDHAQKLHLLLAAEEIDVSDSMKTSLNFN